MNDFVAVLEQARSEGDTAGVADLVPYGRLLGIQFEELSDGALVFRLPFQQRNIGNPFLPALHGGVIGAFMEHAAILHLLWRQETTRLPKVIDFSIDYLRPGRPEEVLARCEVRRQGKRVANVGVVAWHGGDEDRMIATARSHFLLGGH